MTGREIGWRSARGPLILGLTGSIGMGKSTVAAMFRRDGVPVFDADAAVRALQGPGGRALPLIEAAFPGVTSEAGLDRAGLGARVFGKPEALRQLEAIMHPLAAAERRAFLQRHARARVVVLDVPLLFETGGDRYCDLVAVASAPARVQRARVLGRPGMSAAKLRAVLSHQLPDAEKRARADVVIPTGRGRRATLSAVRQLLRQLGVARRRS
jgi:dephospho-CoA kinase